MALENFVDQGKEPGSYCLQFFARIHVVVDPARAGRVAVEIVLHPFRPILFAVGGGVSVFSRCPVVDGLLKDLLEPVVEVGSTERRPKLWIVCENS